MKKAEETENKESKDDKPFVNAGDIGALKISFLLYTRTTKIVPAKSFQR